MAKYFEKGKRRNDQKEYQQIKMFSLKLCTFCIIPSQPLTLFHRWIIINVDHYLMITNDHCQLIMSVGCVTRIIINDFCDHIYN